VIDDSADTHYWRTVDRVMAETGFDGVHRKHMTRLGFGRSIADAWSLVAPDVEFIFGLEDDFVFEQRVDLSGMACVLANHPEVVQVVLLRQPWNEEERAAGGIMQCHPDDFVEHVDADLLLAWCEHRRFFSTNPSLYRRSLIDEGWPDVEHSEGVFTHQLLAKYPDSKFAFWGRKDDPPRVTHIGEHRVGTGY
jgi:hypothetical protein